MEIRRCKPFQRARRKNAMTSCSENTKAEMSRSNSKRRKKRKNANDYINMDEDASLTVEVARAMKVSELRKKLEELGVKSDGSKKTLVNRVKYYCTPSRGFPKKRKRNDADTLPKTKRRKLNKNENNASNWNRKKDKIETTEIRIRLPNGRILQRSFDVDTKINELYIWCMIESNGKDISLMISNNAQPTFG